ncbi:hypothetical protein LXT12_17900 [Pelomonas sp. P7]|uniref:Lipoprotein n=1 Tax=Pelomonas caseinilytica TaxID=2906763 RepID=A0ABS8XKI9_9BURK|nr:hypothetical protein [Pelomonas sp. P7]MCE4539128.1 hypothetical protein [Pelomonas sp. P7]
MKPARPLVALLACAALASCAQTPPTAAQPESARLAKELQALIGPAACTSDSQCRTQAVGAKACGGPAGYVAWSVQGTDARALAELAARQSAAQRRELEASGLRSNCAVATDPGAACVAGRCQLAGAAGPDAQAGKPFSLRAGASVRLPAQGLRIGFDGVTADSRCPKGEQCIVAGDATVRLWWQHEGGPRQALELHTDARAQRSAPVGELDLVLLSLTPEPVTGKATDRRAYEATLRLGDGAAGKAER